MRKKTIVDYIVILIFLGIAVYIVMGWIKEKNSLSVETMDIKEFYEVADDRMLVIENGLLTEREIPYLDGRVYLPLDYVQKHNDRFYWDKGTEKLIYTTGDEIRLIAPDEKEYVSENGFIEGDEVTDGIKCPVDYIILREVDKVMYIAYDFVKEFLDVTVTAVLDPNRAIIRSKWGEYLFTKVKADTQLRSEGNVKGKVLRELPAGTKLELTDSNGANRNGFLLAMTEDGVLAYVDEKFLEKASFEDITSGFREASYAKNSLGESVKLAWNIVVSKEKNNDITNLMKNVSGVNVLSPTWFNTKDEKGGIEDRASADYVKKAHDKGIKVWALVSNFNPGTNKLVIDEGKLLSDRKARAALIRNLTDAADKYGFDGINVDFENLTKEEGSHYVQFIRELSVACRHKDLVLSVDNYVPFDFNSFYDIAEQSCYADYIMIMAYDEHYVGTEAGSVASLTYVKTALENTLNKVASRQVVIGMPFYTRIWRVVQLTDGNHKTYSDTASMGDAQKFIQAHSMKGNWYETEAQHYYTSDEGDTTYKIWMEDVDSVTAKLKEISEAGVAGVAGWRLGQEDSAVWPIINEYIR